MVKEVFSGVRRRLGLRPGSNDPDVFQKTIPLTKSRECSSGEFNEILIGLGPRVNNRHFFELWPKKRTAIVNPSRFLTSGHRPVL